MEPIHLPDTTTKHAPPVEQAAEQKKLEQLFQQAQPKLVPNDVQPPKPARLSEVDRLKLENISLKLLNIGSQFEKLVAARSGFSRQFDALRTEYLERYGIDIAVTKIDEDGSFCGPLVQGMRPQVEPVKP